MADDPNRPWWAPDAQGFLAGGIVSICGLALFIRMASTSTVDDKMLDTMITILFSTCLVTVYNYSFGSSRGSTAKDDTTNKIVEKLTSTAPPGASGPVAPIAAPTVVVAWWSVLTPEEQVALSASNDPRVQSFIVSAKNGKASQDDLTYLVGKGLLTQERAAAIAEN